MKEKETKPELEYDYGDVIDPVYELMHTKIRNLYDTIPLMESSNYKVRFRGEYFQEKIRAEKLENYILKIEVGMEKDSQIYVQESFGHNQPKHDCPLELLQEQLYAMKEKLRIFKKRALYENIELEPDGD